MLRGGSWNGQDYFLQVAYRNKSTPTVSGTALVFGVLRSQEGDLLDLSRGECERSLISVEHGFTPVR